MIKDGRFSYIDLCKGVLITMLMISHYFWFANPSSIATNTALLQISKICGIWECFFMSCFFVITGMCSNFDKPFSSFFVKNFNTIIIPALVSLGIFHLLKLEVLYFFKYALLFGGGFWFLSSLFVGKMLYWFLLKTRLSRHYIIVILVIISFLGKLFDDLKLSDNYWYYTNMLNFTLFLGLGNIFKSYIVTKKVAVILSVLFVVIIVAYKINNTYIPNVVSRFNESMLEHPMTILLSMTGSVFCLNICRLIGSNIVFEYIGKNSLIIYIYHLHFLGLIIAAISQSIEMNGMSLFNTLLLVIISVVGTLFFSSCLALIINTKYLKWMKGSF